MLRSCQNDEKHDLTLAITCALMVMSESMYTLRLQTEETGSTYAAPISTNKLESVAGDGQRSTIGPPF